MKIALPSMAPSPLVMDVEALLIAIVVAVPLSVATTVGVADGFWLNDAISVALADTAVEASKAKANPYLIIACSMHEVK